MDAERFGSPFECEQENGLSSQRLLRERRKGLRPGTWDEKAELAELAPLRVASGNRSLVRIVSQAD